MTAFRSHRDNQRVLVEMWTVDALDGDHAAAALLSQLLWWFQPAKGTRSPRVRYEREGHLWLIRSDDDWFDDCRLSTKQVRRIRKALIERGFIVHRRFQINGAPTGAWRPDFEALERYVADYEAERPDGQFTPPTNAQMDESIRPAGQVPIDTDLSHTPNTKPEKHLSVVASDDDPVQQVFVAWQAATGKARAVLDGKRRTKITNALKRFPVDDLVDAVRGWKHSAFHCGQNEHGTIHNDLDLLLRDAKHVEQFRDWERDINRPAARTGPAAFAAGVERARARQASGRPNLFAPGATAVATLAAAD